MFGIGVGPALIIATVLGVEVFDIALASIAPAVAVLMCLAAYAVSRETLLLHLCMAVMMFAMLTPSFSFLFAHSEGAPPSWLVEIASALTSNDVVIAVSAVTFILAMILGIFGPLRHAKSVDDLLKEHDSLQ